MAPSERPWFRTYTEMTRDRKLRREPPATRWLWITLLCMAGQSPERGSLFIGNSPARIQDIADEAALPLSKVRVGMTALEAAGMIEKNGSGAWHLRNWSERQYESDLSTERVRAFRQRQRNVPSAVSGTPPDTESDTDSSSVPTGTEPPCGKPANAEDEAPQEEQPPFEPNAVLFTAVLERVARAKWEKAVGDNATDQYRDTVRRDVRAKHGVRLSELMVTFPDAPIECYAGELLGEPNTLGRYRTTTEIDAHAAD